MFFYRTCLRHKPVHLSHRNILLFIEGFLLLNGFAGNHVADIQLIHPKPIRKFVYVLQLLRIIRCDHERNATGICL